MYPASVQFSCSVVSNSLWPHELQHARPPCPSPTPGVHSNSCLSTVMPSSHLILCRPLLLLLPILPSIRVFSNESDFRIRCPKSIAVSASTSVLPMNMQDWSPLGWLDLLAVQGTLKSLLQHHISKASIIWCSAFFAVKFSYPYMSTGKTIPLTRWNFVGKITSL